jgi:hypothetical protein
MTLERLAGKKALADLTIRTDKACVIFRPSDIHATLKKFVTGEMLTQVARQRSLYVVTRETTHDDWVHAAVGNRVALTGLNVHLIAYDHLAEMASTVDEIGHSVVVPVTQVGGLLDGVQRMIRRVDAECPRMQLARLPTIVSSDPAAIGLPIGTIVCTRPPRSHRHSLAVVCEKQPGL